MIRATNVVSTSSQADRYRHSTIDRSIALGIPDELEQVQEEAEIEMLRAKVRHCGWISIDTSHD